MFEKNVEKEFPPQMIYNANVREHDRMEKIVDGKRCVEGLYEVTFLIYNNDGLFRNDIGRDIDLGQDIARPVLFVLITENAGTKNEKTYINRMVTPSSYYPQVD